MKMDYDILSKDYDLTRNVNIDTIKRLLSKIEVDENTNVLDFGCGTGNYACAIRQLTNANIYGVEPSDGMRQKAQEKNPEIPFLDGNHMFIPADNDFFDFVYMTDVIHHVPDLHTMFKEFYRILKPYGLVCILTESHKQIETRFWSAYFPDTVIAEKQRYPDIPEIISEATQCGFSLDENMVTDTCKQIKITPEFVNLVKNKGYSMFRLIDESAFNTGLEKLQKDFTNDIILNSFHGETLLWLKKVHPLE